MRADAVITADLESTDSVLSVSVVGFPTDVVEAEVTASLEDCILDTEPSIGATVVGVGTVLAAAEVVGGGGGGCDGF